MKDKIVTVVGEVKFEHLTKSAQTTKKTTLKKTEIKKDK